MTKSIRKVSLPFFKMGSVSNKKYRSEKRFMRTKIDLVYFCVQKIRPVSGTLAAD